MRRIRPLVLAAFAAFLLLIAQAPGEEPRDFNGTWVMKIGSQILFIVTLTPGSDGVQGELERPAKLTMSGSRIWNIGSSIRTDRIVSSHFANGILHLTTQNPNDLSDKADFAMSIRGNQATLAFENLPLGVSVDPFPLEKATKEAKIATDWNPERSYFIGGSDIPNPEMKAIFDEDQRVRASGKIDWNKVNLSDAERRQQTRKLLAESALHTGKDFEEASFVFQHGNGPQDFLLAHSLAMVAISKGDDDAIWIAAATLDRYLQGIGQKQIFGTQYRLQSKDNWTQEPYDRELISDALRKQLVVPSQSEQTKQLEEYQNQK